MGVSGSYQESPSSRSLLVVHTHPAPFFFTSHAKTPSNRVVVVPSPSHPASFPAFSPPSRESPFPTLSLFFPPCRPATLGAALRGRATRGDTYRIASGHSPARGWLARSLELGRAGGSGAAAPGRAPPPPRPLPPSHPPSFLPSLPCAGCLE